MEAKVTWTGGMAFTGISYSEIEIPLAAHKAEDGTCPGLKPMELIAIGLAGCTAMDVISIMEKKRQQVSKFEVTTTTERATEHPRVFTSVLLTYKVTGKDIDPEALERAIQLSADKYCPAQAMLSKAVKIDTRYEIIPE